MLLEHDGQIIDQVNYAEPIGYPHVLDLESDGNLEILVPFVRNDSLFASFVDAQAQELYQIYLAKGKPRQVPSGHKPWDPQVRGIFLEDVNADGRAELITIIATRLARLPRGVWVHTLPKGKLLGKKIIGAIPSVHESFLGDFDEDGRLEILLATGASDNGAVAAGMDDRHSYLIAFDLGLPPLVQPSVEWHVEMGDLWTQMHLFPGDLDGDGKNEFLAFKQTLMGRPPTRAQLWLIDPGTGHPYRENTLAESLTGIAVVNLDDDAQDEILALGVSGELTVLNDELDLVERHRIGDEPVYPRRNTITILPDDVDGDGSNEIIVHTQSGDMFLDSQLRVKAILPSRNSDWDVVRQGIGRLPYLHATHEDGSSVYRLVKNRFYLVNRYGPSLVWIVLVGLWLVGGFLVVSNYRKNRQLDEAIRNNVRKYTGQAEDDFIDRAFEVMGDHYSDSRFTVEAFADKMRCSPRKLQRDLKAKTGRSPSRLIRVFRLERAKKLLEDSELTIKEIAHKVGFESPEYFSTTFRKDEGVSPSAYRKNVASSNSSKSS